MFHIGEKVTIHRVGVSANFPYEVENVYTPEQKGDPFYTLKGLPGPFSENELERYTMDKEYWICAEREGNEVTVTLYECGEDPDGADDKPIHSAKGIIKRGTHGPAGYMGAVSWATKQIWNDLGGGVSDDGQRTARRVI